MLALVNAEAEDVNLKNCALGGSIILSTGGSTFVSAEGHAHLYVVTTVSDVTTLIFVALKEKWEKICITEIELLNAMCCES